MSRACGSQRGFVLLNALVLVAAFAAAAVFVLERAERARQRQAETQGAGQARLYLDAFEALALTLLSRDQQAGALDHRGEAWAQIGGAEGQAVILDRGQVRGQIHDLQGRFNVNWLANPADVVAAEGFVRLLTQLGLPGRLGPEITDFVSPDGPADAQVYTQLSPGVVAKGGPVVFLLQLQVMPGLSDRHYERLAPYLAALPSDSLLNLNTVSPEVLTSLLPGSNLAGLEQALRSRLQQPFVSVEDFATRAAVALPGGTVPEDEQLRFAVGSEWFHSDIAVELEGRILTRQTFFQRRPLPYGPQVAFRLENRT
jgi:general secretion pathway protein K